MPEVDNPLRWAWCLLCNSHFWPLDPDPAFYKCQLCEHKQFYLFEQSMQETLEAVWNIGAHKAVAELAEAMAIELGLK